MDDLIGTWRLVEWTAQVGDESPQRLFGGDRVVLLTYTPGGRMWATRMRRRGPHLGSHTLAGASSAARAEAAAGHGGPDVELSTPPETTGDGRTVVDRLRWGRVGAR